MGTPAVARDGQTYVGVEGGYVHPNDIQFDINGSETNQTLVNNKDGWEAGFVAGHDFGMFRLEAEAAYKDFDVHTVVSNTTPIPLATAPGGRGTFTSIDGGIDVATFMANALFDIGGNDGIGFSAGGGVGYAILDGNFTANSAGPGIVIDKDHGFAYQGVAALRVPVTSNIDAGIKYKYLVIPSVDLVNSQGLRYSDDFESHSVLAHLIHERGNSGLTGMA